MLILSISIYLYQYLYKKIMLKNIQQKNQILNFWKKTLLVGTVDYYHKINLKTNDGGR